MLELRERKEERRLRDKGSLRELPFDEAIVFVRAALFPGPTDHAAVLTLAGVAQIQYSDPWKQACKRRGQQSGSRGEL